MNENIGGKRVKILRKSLNLTLEKFGERVGVTKVAISNIENGNRSLTDQMRTSICREFGVREEWLRDGTGEMFQERTRSEEIKEYLDRIDAPDGFRIRLFHILTKLDDSEWSVLEKIAVELAGDRVPHEPTVEELEEEYKKSVSNSARSTGSIASNSTGDTGGDRAVGAQAP